MDTNKQIKIGNSFGTIPVGSPADPTRTVAQTDAYFQNLSNKNPEQADILMDRYGYTNSPNVITPGALQPAQPIPILPQPPVDTGTGASAVAGAETQANDFQTNYQNYLNNINQQTPEKMSFDNLLKEFTTASENTLGQGQIQLQAEQQAGLPAKYQERAGVQGQIKTGIAEYNRLKAEYDAQKANIEAGAGRKGLTTGAVMGQQGAVQRAAESALNAKAADIQILQAQDQALAGDIEAAQNTVNRAVDLMYKDREAVLALKRDQLNIAKEFLSDADKKRAEARDYAYKKEEQKIAEAKENEKAIQSIALKIAEFGGDPNIIKNAKTPLEAISMAGNKLQDPKSRLELQKLGLEIQKIARENALIGQPTATEKAAEKKALASKDSQNLVLQDKLDLINTIKSSSGISTRVGANIASRKATGAGGVFGRALAGGVAGGLAGLPFGGAGAIPGAIIGAGVGLFKNIPNEVTGKGQVFSGAVHRLASQEFIDNLIEAKKSGATFGALTDREGDALRAAATQLNDWEIKDKDGKGTGVWNIDEKSFLEEVNRIESLSRKAMGTTFTEDENQLLDTVFGADGATLQADPSVYFNQ